MHRLIGSYLSRPAAHRQYIDCMDTGMRRQSIRMLSAGDTAEILRTIRVEDVAIFAKITGDTNPIHVDEKAGRASRFGQCVVHGAFLNGIVSSLLGTVLPGPGTIVVHQYLEFPNALFVGDEVKAKVEITLVKRSIVECVFACEATQRQKVVLKGYAKLLYRNSRNNADETKT